MPFTCCWGHGTNYLFVRGCGKKKLSHLWLAPTTKPSMQLFESEWLHAQSQIFLGYQKDGVWGLIHSWTIFQRGDRWEDIGLSKRRYIFGSKDKFKRSQWDLRGSGFCKIVSEVSTSARFWVEIPGEANQKKKYCVASLTVWTPPKVLHTRPSNLISPHVSEE